MGKLTALYRSAPKALQVGFWVLVVGIIASTQAKPTTNNSQSATDKSSVVRPAAELGQETTPQPLTAVLSSESVSETSVVPFSTKYIDDTTIEKGKTTTKTSGIAGVKTTIYEVSYQDGVETSRKFISEQITTEPIDEVIAVGTYVKPKPTAVATPRPVKTSSCDPNYSGGCVPIASDVDCAGGSGNGPAYVSGPVTVIGTDIYDLDRDNDGYGCE